MEITKKGRCHTFKKNKKKNFLLKKKLKAAKTKCRDKSENKLSRELKAMKIARFPS